MQHLPKLKLLIANQFEEISRRIQKIIGSLDYVCVVGMAENIKETSAIIETTKPDVIILNFESPENANLIMLNKIRDRQLPIKVIIFTNRLDAFYKYSCIECGADFFLETSSDLETIPQLLKHIAKAA